MIDCDAISILEQGKKGLHLIGPFVRIFLVSAEHLMELSLWSVWEDCVALASIIYPTERRW